MEQKESNIVYNLIEVKENPVDTVFEKISERKLKFTIRDLANETYDYEKKLKELEGQKELDKAYVELAIKKYPEIETMDVDLMKSITVYIAKSESLKKIEEVIPEYKEAIKTNKEELENICERFSIDLDSNEKNEINDTDIQQDQAE